MPEFLDKLTVKVDGEEADGLKYSFNKEDQLVVSFDELTIDMNKSKLFVISASLADFDEYGEHVAYYLADKADISAVEKKTGARLDVAGTALKKTNAIRHAFNGGKIKLSNTKLGKLDASQGTEGLVIGEGNITLTEPIHKLGFTLSATGTSKAYVTRVTMLVAGEEYEAKKSGTDFTFSKVEIEKSGKIQFKIDIDDKDAAQSGTISLTPNFNGDLFEDAEYQNARKETVSSGDVSGTISFSTVTVQAAKATFKNSLSKAVEFMNNDTNDGVVFDGTYTAKKANINLNKFYMSGAANGDKIKVTYYLYVEGKEVASVDAYGTGAEETFDDIVVKAGESVKVRVVAEVEAYGAAKTLSGVQVFLGGTDDFDKDVEYKGAKLVDMKIVEKGSVNINAGEINKNVLLKAKNQLLAQFTVKPADGASSVEIENISFSLTNSKTDADNTITADDISVMLGNDELEADSDFVYTDIDKTIKDTVTVKIILNEEKAGVVTVKDIKVNTKKLSKEYVSQFEKAVVRLNTCKDLEDGWTKFTFKVEKDDDVEVRNLQLTFADSYATADLYTKEVDNSTVVEARNTGTVASSLQTITYYVCETSEDDTGTCSLNHGVIPATYAAATPNSGNFASGTYYTRSGDAEPYTYTIAESFDENETYYTQTAAEQPAVNHTTQEACEAANGTWTSTASASCTSNSANMVTIDKSSLSDYFLVDGVNAKAYPKK